MDRRKTDRRGNGYADMYILDVQKMLDILWRRRIILILLTAILLVPGVLFVLFKPVLYKATTSVIVEEQELNLADFQDALPPGKFDDMTIETQVKVIASPKVLYQTLDALQKQQSSETPAPADEKEAQAARTKQLMQFAQNLEVAPQGRSRVISISYTSEDPYQAAEIANMHAASYVQFQIDSRKEQVALLNKWISDQVDLLKEESKVKSKAVQDFRKESGITLGKNSQDLIYEQISDISAQLVPIETQKLNLQSRLDALDQSNTQGAITEVIDSALIQNLKSQASGAQQDVKSLGANLGKNHPDYKAAQKRVAQANADIGRETGSIKTSILIDLDAATRQEALLRQRLDELNVQASDIRSKEITLESLEADEEANRTLLDNFLARSQEIKSQLDYARAGVQIVSPAEVPSDPTGTSKKILLAIIILFAVVIATGLVLALELIDRGIEDAEDVKKLLNLRLIGVLPRAKNPLQETASKKRSPYFEEIKRIYLALSAKKIPQAVLFTSSISDEGKSAFVVAFARYLQSIHAKVVVVDANTIDPLIAGVAQIQPTPGFAEVLSGSQDMTRIVHKDDEGLSIIPQGNHAASGVDILGSDALARLITSLKTQYDFVLIDSAPVTASTDAEVIAGLVDQVVLVVEWAKAPKKTLKKVAEILRQFSKEVPSAIVNKKP